MFKNYFLRKFCKCFILRMKLHKLAIVSVSRQNSTKALCNYHGVVSAYELYPPGEGRITTERWNDFLCMAGTEYVFQVNYPELLTCPKKQTLKKISKFFKALGLKVTEIHITTNGQNFVHYVS